MVQTPFSGPSGTAGVYALAAKRSGSRGTLKDAALAGYLADRPAGALVWPGTWADRAADMLRLDLEAAGRNHRLLPDRVGDAHPEPVPSERKVQVVPHLRDRYLRPVVDTRSRRNVVGDERRCRAVVSYSQAFP